MKGNKKHKTGINWTILVITVLITIYIEEDKKNVKLVILKEKESKLHSQL